MHGRKVNTSCTMVYDLNAGQYVAMGWSWFPLYWGSRALVSKSISGPGIATMNWSWTYPPAQGGLSICTTCPNVKSVITTDPAGVVSRQTFGIHSQVNEGWLVQLDEAWNGSNGLRTTSYQYRDKAAGPYPSPVGYSGNPRSDALASQHHTPQAQRIVTQQGVNFTWQANSFDSFARAVSVTRLSSLGYSKTESTAYNDNLTKWMLGRLASVTDSGGAVERQTTYNATTGLPTASFGYGRLLKSYEHYANGLLNVQRDAVGRGTVYTAYMRGVPQSIVYPDAAAESAVVNGLGWVTSTTNAVGTTTSYGYDAAGRLASISYPGEAGFAYHPTTLTYEQVPAAEYGIAAGHWRQTLSTGNSTTVRYLDALWRTRLERTWDRANEGATSRIAETRYDFGGREAFVSYPQRSLTGVDGALLGASSTYDALGRVTTQTQDSELGALSTVTAYLGNFQTRVTNSRGHASTFSYQAFDQPSEGTITSISAPEGVTVSIVRDVFGKPNAITRAGTWAGSGLSATRRYGYDAHQRLCKTIEPETGATIQAYDVAGNLAWRASGQSSTSTAACDQASVAAGSKVSFGYDARNRLTGTTFGDGQPGIARSYTPDSLQQQVVSSSFTWTYAYNNRRLLVQEQFSVPGQAPGAGWNFSWGVDAHGSVSSLSDPWGTMSYAPNALGEPTQVSGYASAVSYHPNGAVAGYTLANGITRGVSLNARGLPAQWQDAGVVNDQYSYDANGNVTGIQDLLQGINTRSLGYDGLDRLTTANGPWGSGQFGYDALDNLRSSQLGGRTLTHAIDPTTNRLTGLSGSQSVAMGYDTNGNLAQRGAQGYGFDIGNRMRAAWGKASYDYDGHGRRSWVVYADASTLLNAYSGTGAAGQLRFSAHSVKGNTRYVYLGDKLIAETNSQTGTRFSHTDALGSPVARTNSSGVLLERTRYEPYGATVAGSTNPASIGFTGHVNDADTGLLYMQRKRLGAAP